MSDPRELASVIERVRRFTRFYTRRLEVLDEQLLNSPFTLTEARIVYELARSPGTSAKAVATDLGLDPSYLSRTLSRLQDRGVLTRSRSNTDARESRLRLTRLGRQGFNSINKRSQQQVGDLLENLGPLGRHRLVEAMGTIETLLDPAAGDGAPYLLRHHQPGDIGWVVRAHGLLYAREYGWDQTFEALVAKVAATFIDKFDPRHECCWIAEMNGRIVGSVFVVRQSSRVAKLRLLIVDPQARGLGIGKRLVHECIRFARDNGYRTLTLWTNDVLVMARRIYQQAGFTLTRSEPHHSFGHDLVGEHWDLTL
ncbi:MAG: bifunctional helix-turn-helix transcriptional regulator/GNAT family N-acetyltransferase [Burkholderiaceae bacterium]